MDAMKLKIDACNNVYASVHTMTCRDTAVCYS